MERLTEKAKIGYREKNNDYSIKVSIQKLGKLEDIEEELGIPLEVLFKALKDGFWFKDSYRTYFVKQASVFNGVSGTYWFSGIGTMIKVKDYGKTWWLEEPKEELENAKD